MFVYGDKNAWGYKNIESVRMEKKLYVYTLVKDKKNKQSYSKNFPLHSTRLNLLHLNQTKLTFSKKPHYPQRSLRHPSGRRQKSWPSPETTQTHSTVPKDY